VKAYDIDFEDFKVFCNNHTILNGFYLMAYLESKNPTLRNWINKTSGGMNNNEPGKETIN
jgi:hypothetical protein